MPLNPAGSNPIVQVTFASLDSGSCTLFIKKITDSSWHQIFAPFNNHGGDGFSFTIDPTKDPIKGISLSNLVSCKLGWVVQYFNLDKNPGIIFSFEISINQSGSTIISNTTTEKDSNVAFGPDGNTAAFSGVFDL
jgi:hypothetical protein